MPLPIEREEEKNWRASCEQEKKEIRKARGFLLWASGGFDRI